MEAINSEARRSAATALGYRLPRAVAQPSVPIPYCFLSPLKAQPGLRGTAVQLPRLSYGDKNYSPPNAVIPFNNHVYANTQIIIMMIIIRQFIRHRNMSIKSLQGRRTCLLLPLRWQSGVLRLHVVRLSVRLYVCNFGGSGLYTRRLEISETNCISPTPSLFMAQSK